MSISFLRNQRAQILFVLLLWTAQVLLINPHGEFPSNDDWAFALSVREAVEHGRFFVSGWAGMNLIAQIGWGSLFCLPFGFSFTALRISTLVAGGLGLWGTYKLIQESTNPSTALVGSLIMAVNPLYLGLSATFMTDVPFYAAVIWAYYFLVVGLKTDTIKPILIGLGLGIVSLLIRQFGIVVFFSFSLAYIVRKGINWRSVAVVSACSAGAVIFQAVYQKWLIWMMNKATIYNAQTTNILKLKFLSSNFLHDFTNNIFIMIVYLGLFLFPFLVIMAATSFTILRRNILLIAGLSVLIFTLWIYLFDGAKMVIWWNIINVHGLGPLSMRDVYFHLYNLPVPFVLEIILIGITAFSLVGGVWILLYLIRLFPILISQNIGVNQRAVGVLLLSAGVIYCGPLALQGLFDRYLIFPIPLLVILIHQVCQYYNQSLKVSPIKPLLYVAMFLYGAYWLFSVGATHDYLAWNRVRWQALNTMMEQDRIPPTEIDGGLEFNGLYLYNEAYKMTADKSFWWVERDTYVVGASLLPGYRQFRRYEVNKWLPWGIEKIIVGKK